MYMRIYSVRLFFFVGILYNIMAPTRGKSNNKRRKGSRGGKRLPGRKMKTPCRTRNKRGCKRAKRHCASITRKNKSGSQRTYCRKRKGVY